MALKVFGDVDRDSKGNVRSEFPAFYFEQAKDDLATKISEMEKALEDDAIPQTARPRFREALREKKERLEKIEESTPKLKDLERDNVAKMRQDMVKELKEQHPRYKDQEKGLTDAHEEARKMTEPYIKLKDEKMAEFAKECNIKISPDGKITRNDMDKMFKISSKMLGEVTDIEYLRRD